MIPVTLVYPYPLGHHVGKQKDVDLHGMPRVGEFLGGMISTLIARVERVEQFTVQSGRRVLVWISIPGRPTGVPESYWTDSGWTSDGC